MNRSLVKKLYGILTIAGTLQDLSFGTLEDLSKYGTLQYFEFDYSSDYVDYYYNPVMDAIMDVIEMFYIFGRLSDIIRLWCVSTGFLCQNDMH